MTTNTAKKLSVRLGSLGLATLLTVACGSGNEQNSESSIYGGSKTASGEWLNVVALASTSSGVFCSGTAVTPNVVVTAAHCADAMRNVKSISVYTGAGRSSGAFLGQNAITKVNAHPSYRGLDHDVSYVVLAKALTLPSTAYVPVVQTQAENDELMKVGKSTRIIGFGQRETGDYGVKYQVDAPIKSINQTEVAIGGQGKDSCQGDSGGPAFAQLANGQWRYVGVVSRGGRCGSGGVYGLVTANICWVQRDSGLDLGLPKGACGTATTTASN